MSIIDAYVDGLPIFKFDGSILLINDASLYLVGGFLQFSIPFISSHSKLAFLNVFEFNLVLGVFPSIIKNPSKKVFVGDRINLQIPRPQKTSLKPYNFKLDIVYEDENLLVLNNPAGITRHPGAGIMIKQ